MLYINLVEVGDMLTNKVEIGNELFGGNMKVISKNALTGEVGVEILDYYEHNKPVRICGTNRYATLKLGYSDEWGQRTGVCYMHLRMYQHMFVLYEFSEENRKRLFVQ